MEHISGNKIRIGSIEVPMDREYPGAETVKASQIAICFYGLQSEKMQKRGTKWSR
jgi:hypothetical protein